MTTWIDFKEMRSALDFAEVLRYYKVELKLKGDQHHGFCPLPSHEGKRNSPSFSANIRKKIWQCFGCGQKGNILDFAVLMEKANPDSGEEVRGVALKLQERFLGAAPPPPNQPAADRKDEKIIVNAPLDFELKGLDAGHPYLRKRGFTPKTIEAFGLGFCSRGLLTDRLAIPLCDVAGSLIGYAGRLVDDSLISEKNPKYRFPGKRERNGVIHEFHKSAFLYNANRISTPVEHLAVVEGFASVWWLFQAGIPDVVATMGAAVSGEQARDIVSLVTLSGHVSIISDGDEAGIRWAESMLPMVAPHRFIRWVMLEGGLQPTSLSREELRERFIVNA